MMDGFCILLRILPLYILVKLIELGKYIICNWRIIFIQRDVTQYHIITSCNWLNCNNNLLEQSDQRTTQNNELRPRVTGESHGNSVINISASRAPKRFDHLKDEFTVHINVYLYLIIFFQ